MRLLHVLKNICILNWMLMQQSDITLKPAETGNKIVWAVEPWVQWAVGLTGLVLVIDLEGLGFCSFKHSKAVLGV